MDRLDAVGFKPRAGNDHWFDHDDGRRAVEAGRRYGTDAKRLAAASATDVAPEEVTPVHRLWRPDPGPGTGLLGRERRTFVVDRVGDRYVVDGSADVAAAAREVVGASAREGRFEARVGDVVEPLDHAATVPLPALPGDERDDPAAPYGEAYDALLSVARE